MKYKTIIDHWEVEYVLKRYDDGSPLLLQTRFLETEADAIKLAKEKKAIGQDPSVRVVENVYGW